MTPFRARTFSAVTLSLGLILFPAAASATTTPMVSYYLGEIKMIGPTGKAAGTALSLTKRTMDPNVSVIVEELLHVSNQGEVKQYLSAMKVKGSQFSLKDTEGSFHGQGTLHGKPWQWDRWDTQVTLKDGSGSYRSRHHLLSGGILIKKDFYDAQGKLRLKFTEDLRAISQDAYEIIHAKLAKPASGKAPVG